MLADRLLEHDQPALAGVDLDRRARTGLLASAGPEVHVGQDVADRVRGLEDRLDVVRALRVLAQRVDVEEADPGDELPQALQVATPHPLLHAAESRLDVAGRKMRIVGSLREEELAVSDRGGTALHPELVLAEAELRALRSVQHEPALEPVTRIGGVEGQERTVRHVRTVRTVGSLANLAALPQPGEDAQHG